MSNPDQQQSCNQPNRNPGQSQNQGQGPKREPDVREDNDRDSGDENGQKQYLGDSDDDVALEDYGRSDDITKPNMLTPMRHPLNPQPRAAKGDDDLMSRQQFQAMPSVDSIKGKWQQQIGAAKIAWGKLTEDELLKSEGHEQKLAGLVQERYAITRDEAEKQVKNFVHKLRH